MIDGIILAFGINPIKNNLVVVFFSGWTWNIVFIKIYLVNNGLVGAESQDQIS